MRHDQVARDPDHPDRIPFSLEKGMSSSDLQGMNALIHCAYDFRATRWRDIARVNVDGSARLFEAAQAAGVSRIVCLSTMSAFEGCRSLYGKAKLAIEKTALRFGAVRVRPGLIYGDRPGGTVGALERVVSMSPIVPLVDDGRYLLYLAHEEDLCRLAHELCDRAELSDRMRSMGPITAAAEGPHSLREILETLARRRGKRVAFVPVPRCWILGPLRAVESVGLRAGVRSDSLISLVNQDPSPDFGPTREMHTSFRSFDTGR
jgi:nucleoside-diphosphate-sugar epimerase